MRYELLFGRHPIHESLRAGRRKASRLLVNKKSQDSAPVQEIIELAKKNKIQVDYVPRDRLDSLIKGGNHQGVVLEASSYPYTDVDDILDYARACGQPPFILLLDLLQDVQNVATLLRTAEAVGVHGVILQDRRAAQITPAVVGASSGAVEHMRIAQVTNLVNTIKELQKADIWIGGLDMASDSNRYDQANLKGAIGLVVGSEGKGIRRLVGETCDFIIHLPMQGKIESLNASTAASIALYAAWQARDFSINQS